MTSEIRQYSGLLVAEAAIIFVGIAVLVEMGEDEEANEGRLLRVGITEGVQP